MYFKLRFRYHIPKHLLVGETNLEDIPMNLLSTYLQMLRHVFRLLIPKNRLGHLYTLALTSSLLACSSINIEEVEYTVYHTPTAKYKKMRFIGVTKVNKIPALTNYLVQEMDKCRLYSKANGLEKVFKLSPQQDENKLKLTLKDQANQFQDARYVHGVLVVEVLKNQTKIINRTKNIWHANDSQHYTWMDSYGNASLPTQRLYAGEAISPKITYEVKSKPEKDVQVEMTIRAVLYNKRSNEIVFDQVTSLSSKFSFYEEGKFNRPKKLVKDLAEQLLQRVARKSCPRLARVERQLISQNEDGRVHSLTEKGIDSANAGRWERAADYWKKAILVDKKHAPALHNLGVYYERLGDIPRAMEEFGKAKNAGLPKEVEAIQFDESLELFRPAIDSWQPSPTILSVSGANWVLIQNLDSRKYEVGKSYPVYRSELLLRDKNVLGTNLFQTGKVRIVKKESDIVLARIEEFVEDYQINPGDILVTN